jgi:hypothetical protein
VTSYIVRQFERNMEERIDTLYQLQPINARRSGRDQLALGSCRVRHAAGKTRTSGVGIRMPSSMMQPNA